jgi:hypothetical protein
MANYLKSKIIAEILAWYKTAPTEFYGSSLLTHVQFQIRVKYDRYPFEQSIMRIFQQLRKDGVIDCKCTDPMHSKYVKG